MGRYNPYAPYVVGQELVPITDTSIQFNPTVEKVEYGVGIHIDTPVIVTGGWLARHFTAPGEDVAGGVKQINIYKYPLQSPGTLLTEIIPVSSADVTGQPLFQIVSRNVLSSGMPLPAYYASILATPDQRIPNVGFEAAAVPLGVVKDRDPFNAGITYNGNQMWLSFGFAVESFTEQLNFNRILNVSLLYSGFALQKHRTDNTPGVPPLYGDGWGVSYSNYIGEYFEPYKGQSDNAPSTSVGTDPGDTVLAWLTTIFYPPTYHLDALNSCIQMHPDQDYGFLTGYNGASGANDPTTGTGVLDLSVVEFNPVTARWEGSNGLVKALDLGDVAIWAPTTYSGAAPVGASTTDPPIPQWSFEKLHALDTNGSASVKRQLAYTTFLPYSSGEQGDGISGSTSFIIDYIAMQVTRTSGQDNRIAAGAGVIGDYSASRYTTVLNTSTTSIQSFDGMTTHIGVGPPIKQGALGYQDIGQLLMPGNYVVTISSPYAGDKGGTLDRSSVFPSPKFGAVWPLHPLPSHPGFAVNIPYASGFGNVQVGKPITVTSSQFIPQITLEVSAGTQTGLALAASQGYGDQAEAYVYGSNVAVQVINDAVVSGSANWPWIRFYARRQPGTTQPLTVTLGGSSVSLTPAAFDQLVALTTDGWAEVTLRFLTIPSFGNGSLPTVTWSSYGTPIGDRWEVLAATSLSNRFVDPGNLSGFDDYIQVGPGYFQDSAYPGPATYGGDNNPATIGATWLPWKTHPNSTATLDATTDICVFLSQDPPAVSGLQVTPSLQLLAVPSSIGNCGIDSCCIPSALWYNQVTWHGRPPGSATYNVISLSDTFGRTVTGGGWGSVEYGGLSYSLSGGISAYTQNNKGYLSVASGTATQTLATGGIADDLDLYVTMTSESSITDGYNFTTGVWFQVVDANNRWEANINRTSAGSTLTVVQRVSGTSTTVWTETLEYLSQEAGSACNLRVMVSENRIKVKVWPATINELSMWNYETTLSPATGTNVAFAVTNASGATRIGSFSNLQISPPRFWFGYYELQRKDDIDPTWRTIMKATNPAVNTFADFEARPGVTSYYQIRCVNSYEFAGFWSSTVQGPMPTVGVEGGCLDGGHVLMFTTNELQDGTGNLAYSSVWMGSSTQADEAFEFPEAGFVQYQQMYQRDFYTAFRPSERGGEQFQRTVLLQATSVSMGLNSTFKTLQDMAWEDVNYVCVRDEAGNRWLAAVTTASGTMMRDRRLKIATVHVAEVTSTPTPVDPNPWTTIL